MGYARWKGGEVDVVHLDGRRKPDWCVEIKWSDRYAGHPRALGGLRKFTSRHTGITPLVTTRASFGRDVSWPGEMRPDLVPTSACCYAVGHSAIRDPSADAPWIVGG